MTKQAERLRTRKLFNIEVNEKDIAKATKNDSYVCVVAQAIARSIPDAHRIDVDSQSIRFSRSGERLVYLTPYAVQGYVIAFDAGEEIKPFSFQLRQPAKVRATRPSPLGRKANQAAYAAKRRVRKEAQAAGLPLDDQTVVNDVRAAAKAAYTEVKAAATDNGEPASLSSRAGRHAPPRVFKRKTRSYGHRLLRINQEHVEQKET